MTDKRIQDYEEITERPMANLANKRQEIVEEFEEKFGTAYRMSEDGSHLVAEVSYIPTEHMKTWLTQALNDYTKHIIKMVEMYQTRYRDVMDLDQDPPILYKKHGEREIDALQKILEELNNYYKQN